jgi:hypothetical protein
MKVLIACEFSGIVREAFKKKGHDAWSCDILDTEVAGNHIKGNVLNILDNGWDMMIAHPPCTYLANSGVQHLHKNKNRWKKMYEAKIFFLKLLQSNIKKICLENPVPHRYCELPDYTQIIQPYFFGHNIMKKTCLWLKNLPILMAENIVDKGEKYIKKSGKSNGSKWCHFISPGKNRWKNRSRTFQGIANAMANQWG